MAEGCIGPLGVGGGHTMCESDGWPQSAAVKHTTAGESGVLSVSMTPLPPPLFQPASWQWQWGLVNVGLAQGSPWNCCAMCQGHCPHQAVMLRTLWAGRWHLQGHLGLAAL